MEMLASAEDHLGEQARQPGHCRLAAFVAEQLLVEDGALRAAATADEAAADADADPAE